MIEDDGRVGSPFLAPTNDEPPPPPPNLEQSQVAEAIEQLRPFPSRETVIADAITRALYILQVETARSDRIDRKAEMILLAAAGIATVVGLLGGGAATALRIFLIIAIVAAILLAAIGLWPRSLDSIGDNDWLATHVWPFPTAANEQYLLGLHRHLHARRAVNEEKARWILGGQCAITAAIILVTLTLALAGPRIDRSSDAAGHAVTGGTAARVP